MNPDDGAVDAGCEELKRGGAAAVVEDEAVGAKLNEEDGAAVEGCAAGVAAAPKAPPKVLPVVPVDPNEPPLPNAGLLAVVLVVTEEEPKGVVVDGAPKAELGLLAAVVVPAEVPKPNKVDVGADPWPRVDVEGVDEGCCPKEDTLVVG